MGQANSRAAVRATSAKPLRKYPESASQGSQSTELPVVSVGEAANTESADASSAVEAASAHKDTGSVSLMNRLVGGVSNRSVDVHDRQGTPRRRTYAEREAALEGRISSVSLLEILQAQKQAKSEGSQVDVSELASRCSPSVQIYI